MTLEEAKALVHSAIMAGINNDLCAAPPPRARVANDRDIRPRQRLARAEIPHSRTAWADAASGAASSPRRRAALDAPAAPAS
eukprot:7374439-Prymnesium_polylepis.1